MHFACQNDQAASATRMRRDPDRATRAVSSALTPRDQLHRVYRGQGSLCASSRGSISKSTTCSSMSCLVTPELVLPQGARNAELVAAIIGGKGTVDTHWCDFGLALQIHLRVPVGVSRTRHVMTTPLSCKVAAVRITHCPPSAALTNLVVRMDSHSLFSTCPQAGTSTLSARPSCFGI